MSQAVMIPPVASELAVEHVQARQLYGWPAAMAIVLCIRALVFAVGVISIHTAGPGQILETYATGIPWVAFDAGFYRDILLHGYPDGPKIPYQIAYFPLYPFACRLLSPFMSAASALLVVANLCTIVGMGFLYAWARSLTDARTAFMTVLLMATFPGAVFFSAGLTEAPFMMLVAIALYLIRKDRIYGAAVCSAFATSLRPTAIALAFVVVMWAVTRSWHLPKGRLFVRFMLVGLISCSGGAAYAGFLRYEYGKWNAYKSAEDKWEQTAGTASGSSNSGGRDLVAADADVRIKPPAVAPIAPRPVRVSAEDGSLKRYSLPFFLNRLKTTQGWNRVFALMLIILVFASCIRPTGVPRITMALPFIVFMMAALPNKGLRVSSIVRYESAGLPMFLVLAVWLSSRSRRPVLHGLLACSLIVQIYYAVLYSRGVWIG